MKAFIIIVIVILILIFIIKRIVKKANERQAREESRQAREESKQYWEKFRAEEKVRKQKELPILIKEANKMIDKYERHIADGQDKYQIGRSLCELQNTYDQRFKEHTYLDTSEADRNDVAAFDKRIAVLCDSDIQLERGYKDFLKDFLKEQNAVSKKQTKPITQQKKEEAITKTFTAGSRGMLEVTVNNYIDTYKRKGYVLVFKAPIEKTLLGLHSTTITMKK